MGQASNDRFGSLKSPTIVYSNVEAAIICLSCCTCQSEFCLQ